MVKKMKIAICCTRNWYIYLATSLYALFKHNQVEKVYLFIEDDEISYLKDKKIEFINVNKVKEYIKKESPNYNTKYSKMSYIRCYFSKVLNEDKVLYIDADAIVVDNIKELWNIDLKNYALAGIKESGEWERHLGIKGMDHKYINSGILLMNLDLIRKLKLDDEMINLLNNNFYHYPDQDVINIVCKDKIKYLGNIYNSTETTGIVNNAKIVHYIRENKGWIKTSPRSDIWFKYFNEMIERSEKAMFKVVVLKEFTLGRFNELKNLVRNNPDKNEKGRLYEKDVFECKKDLVDYLSGNNDYNDEFIKVIEIIPEEKPVKKEEEPIKVEEEIIEKPKTKKTKKKN
jgi:lipopolysaccharide biosynthesis glycosyltransferase